MLKHFRGFTAVFVAFCLVTDPALNLKWPLIQAQEAAVVQTTHLNDQAISPGGLFYGYHSFDSSSFFETDRLFHGVIAVAAGASILGTIFGGFTGKSLASATLLMPLAVLGAVQLLAPKISDPGFGRLGEEAVKRFVSSNDYSIALRSSDMTPLYRELLINALRERIADRRHPISGYERNNIQEQIRLLESDVYRIYGIKSQIVETDDFFLSWHDMERHKLFVSLDFLAWLEERGLPSLVGEFLMCSFLLDSPESTFEGYLGHLLWNFIERRYALKIALRNKRYDFLTALNWLTSEDFPIPQDENSLDRIAQLSLRADILNKRGRTKEALRDLFEARRLLDVVSHFALEKPNEHHGFQRWIDFQVYVVLLSLSDILARSDRRKDALQILRDPRLNRNPDKQADVARLEIQLGLHELAMQRLSHNRMDLKPELALFGHPLEYASVLAETILKDAEKQSSQEQLILRLQQAIGLLSRDEGQSLRSTPAFPKASSLLADLLIAEALAYSGLKNYTQTIIRLRAAEPFLIQYLERTFKNRYIVRIRLARLWTYIAWFLSLLDDSSGSQKAGARGLSFIAEKTKTGWEFITPRDYYEATSEAYALIATLLHTIGHDEQAAGWAARFKSRIPSEFEMYRHGPYQLEKILEAGA